MRWVVFYEDPRDARDFNTTSDIKEIMNKKISYNLVYFDSDLDRNTLLNHVERYGRVKDLDTMELREYKLTYSNNSDAKIAYEAIAVAINKSHGLIATSIPNLNSLSYRLSMHPSIDNIRDVEIIQNEIYFRSYLPLSIITQKLKQFSGKLTKLQIPIKGKNTLETLYNSEYMSDITINAGNKKFNAHKLILASSTEYFKKLFLYNPNLNEIDIDNNDPGLFEKLLKLIYGIDIFDDSILNNLNLILLAESFSVDIKDKDQIIYKNMIRIHVFYPELYDEAMIIANNIYPFGLPDTLKNKIFELFKSRRVDSTFHQPNSPRPTPTIGSNQPTSPGPLPSYRFPPTPTIRPYQPASPGLPTPTIRPYQPTSPGLPTPTIRPYQPTSPNQ